MILIVAPTNEETEALRRVFVKLGVFVYSTAYSGFIHSAEKYAPSLIVLKVNEVTDRLAQKVKEVRALLGDVTLLTLSDADVSLLLPDLSYSTRVHKRTLLYQALYFSANTATASAFVGSRIVSGLFLHPYEGEVYLCGQKPRFTPEEVYLLRYLAEIHPRRAAWTELARHCFPYGKRTSRSSVASRISRINKEARRLIFVPILTDRRGEGYGIDF